MKENKFEKICINIVKIIAISVITLLLVFSIFNTCFIDRAEKTEILKDNIFVNILILAFTIITLFAIKFIMKNRKEISNKFIIIITIIYIVLLAFLVLASILVPTADQGYVVDIAYQIRNHNFEAFNLGGYMTLYSNQNGIVLFFYLLNFIVRTHVSTTMQLLNIIGLIISIIAISKIVFILFENKNIAKITYITLLLFTPMSLYIFFVYGNILGFMFSMIALLFTIKFLQENKKKYIVLAILTVTIAIMLKSNYLITLLAILLMILLKAISEKKPSYFIILIILLVFYKLTGTIVDFTIEKITNTDKNYGAPMVAWIAMGLQESDDRCAGWWNSYNTDVYINNNYDSKKASKDSIESIKESLNKFIVTPAYAADFFYRKISSIWNEPTFQSIWIIQNMKDNSNIEKSDYKFLNPILYEGELNTYYLKYCEIIHLIILFGSFIYFILDFKHINLYKLSFSIIFLGGFLFHIFWEAKGQYTITYFILLIPYAILGYNLLINKIYDKILQSKLISKKGIKNG